MTSGARANPLARGPLETRSGLQRAVRDLYEPLVAHTSPGGARVWLGSFGAIFAPRVAELEGFARPLYGIVPLTVGGGDFDHWDRIVAGLDAGTDPDSDEYWGAITRRDQRMVEQAAIGIALAFCPERVWEPLDADARRRLVDWLSGVIRFEPAPNNWQFFRVLVALGLERVGAPFDRDAVAASLARIEEQRRGAHWYADDGTNIDHYVPFAFHTYGLIYAAATRLGLGDPDRAEAYRERAAGFADDHEHWFAPDGAAIAMGRSLTYRFAMGAFWGALAWADVEPAAGWGRVKGLALRHLRWWAQHPISDRDGVLSVGFTYDNRTLREGYNSPGSPYWCMKAFGALAAPADHPFWTAEEEPTPTTDRPVTLPEARWVVTRDDHQAVALVAPSPRPRPFPEQWAAKYRRFAYSSAFGFSGDVPDSFGRVVGDSTLALTDEQGSRRVHAHVEASGVDGTLTWSIWRPWPDVRVATVCWAIDASWHGRIHLVRSARHLDAEETGFAVGIDPETFEDDGGDTDHGPDRASITSLHGCSALVGAGGRAGSVRRCAVDANLRHPHSAVPALSVALPPGQHELACLVFASPAATAVADRRVEVADAARELLDRLADMPTVASPTLGV